MGELEASKTILKEFIIAVIVPLILPDVQSGVNDIVDDIFTSLIGAILFYIDRIEVDILKKFKIDENTINTIVQTSDLFIGYIIGKFFGWLTSLPINVTSALVKKLQDKADNKSEYTKEDLDKEENVDDKEGDEEGDEEDDDGFNDALKLLITDVLKFLGLYSHYSDTFTLLWSEVRIISMTQFLGYVNTVETTVIFPTTEDLQQNEIEKKQYYHKVLDKYIEDVVSIKELNDVTEDYATCKNELEKIHTDIYDITYISSENIESAKQKIKSYDNILFLLSILLTIEFKWLIDESNVLHWENEELWNNFLPNLVKDLRLHVRKYTVYNASKKGIKEETNNNGTLYFHANRNTHTPENTNALSELRTIFYMYFIIELENIAAEIYM
jgi:hypothetical protein